MQRKLLVVNVTRYSHINVKDSNFYGRLPVSREALTYVRNFLVQLFYITLCQLSVMTEMVVVVIKIRVTGLKWKYY